MSDFEFIFALFGLLLGFSITEVLGGFARSLEARLRPGATLRIGWLTPLLGVFVLLDLISFWRSAWLVRDIVTVTSNGLLAVTLFACAYYLAAHLVFPREARAEEDFDQHFMRVRRIVIGILILLLCCQIGWYLSLPAIRPLLLKPLALGSTILLAALMIAAMAVRSRRWALPLMVALVGRYVVLYLI